MSDFDAVISGYGPVGATLANLLAREGLSVCVVEKYAEIYDKPRAITIDWEVMRVLQFCGVAHELWPDMAPHPGTDFRGIDGRVIKAYDPLPPPWDLGWPPTVTFVQPEMEKALRAALDRRPGVTTCMGQAVTSFEDKGDHVAVEVTDPGRGTTRTITGDFLIGCDGANSEIREAIGGGLKDFAFDESWVVVDAHLLRDTPLPPKCQQYCWPSRPATIILGPGTLRRWELKILPDETPDDFQDEAKVREALTPYVDPAALEIWRSATYRFNARVGIEWRKGRVFLAGDAVHQTPPFLGQGLCAGMRDALNLAWKLVHCQRAGFNDALLDSYQEERRPHVSAVIEAAAGFGEIIGELDEERARRRDEALGAQFAAGEMETSRQGFIPNLEHGVIDDGPGPDGPQDVAGTLMVQPRVRCPDGEERLLDDHAPMAFLFVSDRPEPQSWMDGLEPIWDRLGGRGLVITPEDAPLPAGVPADVEMLREVGDTMARWCARTNLPAGIVRPDRYVYAGVTDRADLEAKLKRLADRLLSNG